MTSARQIAARILEEERQKEAARQAAINAALAKPLPPHVTKDNWTGIGTAGSSVRQHET
jgi:hypothetical protein